MGDFLGKTSIARSLVLGIGKKKLKKAEATRLT